jgi:murein DD-endopeptidase MepM/ murein hydrolase activator NlpD
MKADAGSLQLRRGLLPLTSLLLLPFVASCARTPAADPVLFGRLAPKPHIQAMPLEPAPQPGEPVLASWNPAPARTVPGLWPIMSEDLEIISEFGRRGRREHKGIDIKAPMHSHVIATADGVIAFAGVQRGYGKVVKLDHPAGFQTVYGHLDSIVVKQGERIRAGTILGRLGATGNASTHHVHYEVIMHGNAVDPNPFLPALEHFAAN